MQSIMKGYIKEGNRHGVRFFFMEGTHEHPERGRCWTFDLLKPSDVGSVFLSTQEVEPCVRPIGETIEELQIDALLGFSQGAAMVDAFLSTKEGHRIQKVVLMSPFSVLRKESKKEHTVPTFFVVDDEDTVATPDLIPVEEYLDVRWLLHKKGHKITTSRTHVKEICSFLSS